MKEKTIEIDDLVSFKDKDYEEIGEVINISFTKTTGSDDTDEIVYFSHKSFYSYKRLRRELTLVKKVNNTYKKQICEERSYFKTGDKVRTNIPILTDCVQYPVWGGKKGYVSGEVVEIRTGIRHNKENLTIKWSYPSGRYKYGNVNEVTIQHLTKEDKKLLGTIDSPAEQKSFIRLSDKEEKKLMTPVAHFNNLNSFKKILPYFCYDKTTKKDIIRVSQPHKRDFINQYLDNRLKLNSQRRAFFKVGENNHNNNTSYNTYIKDIMLPLTYNSCATSCICDEFTDGARIRRLILKYNLLSFDVFISGKVQVDKQEQRLFKFLLNNKILNKEQIEIITTTKNSKKNLYLCISRNPIDYLFASTDQGWSSCLNLHSEYEEAAYMGLGALSADPNRLIIFLTDGNLRKHELHHYVLNHFSYISRSWAIAASKNRIVIIQEYPNKSIDFNGLVRQLGFTPIRNVSNDVKNGTLDSLFSFDTPKFEDGRTVSIYMDYFGLQYVKKYIGDYTLNGDRAYDKNLKKVKYGVPGGSTGVFSNFNYNGGFNNITCIEDLYDNHHIYCSECDYEMHEDDAYYNQNGNGAYCSDCYYELYIICQDCDRECWREDTIYVENEDITICQGCADNDYYHCEECGCTVSETLETTDGDLLCFNCAKSFTLCKECGLVDENNFSDDYCESCYSKIYTSCDECGSEIEINESIELEDGSIVCDECNLIEEERKEASN